EGTADRRRCGGGQADEPGGQPGMSDDVWPCDACHNPIEVGDQAFQPTGRTEWFHARCLTLKHLTAKDLTAPTPETGEVRVTSATGGAKGSKLARFDLIPPGPEIELAELYGKGGEKYEDRNWERGYPWHLSYAALRRHLAKFWKGQDRDPQTGTKEIICVAWHASALAEFMETQPECDDRPKR